MHGTAVIPRYGWKFSCIQPSIEWLLLLKEWNQFIDYLSKDAFKTFLILLSSSFSLFSSSLLYYRLFHSCFLHPSAIIFSHLASSSLCYHIFTPHFFIPLLSYFHISLLHGDGSILLRSKYLQRYTSTKLKNFGTYSQFLCIRQQHFCEHILFFQIKLSNVVQYHKEFMTWLLPFL
jgi:hypothetical protein